MKRSFSKIYVIIPILILICFKNLNGQNTDSRYIIVKENGRIIKSYLAFEDFLNSDKSWFSYRKLLLDAYPEMLAVHNKQLSWGTIDSVGFKEEVKDYRKSDWEQYFTRYDDKELNFLYDSLIARANTVLKPLKKTPIDLCMFLPYSSCFIIASESKCTIYISLLIDPVDVHKIMVHEYSHNLHIQRRPEEPFRLKREVVSEGMAVYLTTLIIKDLGIANAIPFMPESSVKWCMANEKMIQDSIKAELNDSTFLSIKKFIADGPGISAPPKGFVEKTAYFAGYRVIEECVKKGMKLEEICSLNSDSVISKSGYFR